MKFSQSISLLICGVLFALSSNSKPLLQSNAQKTVTYSIKQYRAQQVSANRASNLMVANPPISPDSLGVGIIPESTLYTADVLIGTPPRVFSLLIDISFGSIWVYSDTCEKNCGHHPTIGSSSSSFVNDSSRAFNYTVESSNVSGNIGSDTITMIGYSIQSCEFGVLTSQTGYYNRSTFPADGVLGLAESSDPNVTPLTPTHFLYNDEYITERKVSIKLGRPNDNDGEITFGGVDESQIDNTTQVTLKRNESLAPLWTTKIDKVVVGNNSYAEGSTVIFHTITNALAFTSDVAKNIHHQISGAVPSNVVDGQFLIPCNTSVIMSFTFGGVTFDMEPQDLVANQGDSDAMCISNIFGVMPPGPYVVIGTSFLKNVYWTFDSSGSGSITLAKLKST